MGWAAAGIAGVRARAQEDRAPDAEGAHGRAQGQATYVVDFLAGKIGLGGHVLVALHRCLTPSQVKRVVSAYRAGAPLARGLDVSGRSPDAILKDAAFAWTAPLRVVKPDAPSAELDPSHADTILWSEATVSEAAALPRRSGSVQRGVGIIDKIAASIVEELNDESKQSAKVLVETLLFARQHQAVAALCDRLRAMPDRTHGTAFNALLAIAGMSGGVRVEELIEGELARAGVQVEGDASITKLDAHGKLVRAAKLGAADLPLETLEQLIATIPWIVAIWAASHFTLAGPLVDMVGLAFLGKQAVDVLEDLRAYHTLAIEARTEDDLRAAGKKLARALATLGINGVFLLVGAKRRAETPKAEAHEEAPKTEPAPRVVERDAEHVASVGDELPAGWKRISTGDIVTTDPKTGIRTAYVKLLDPSGKEATFVRSYDPRTKELRFEYAFLKHDGYRYVQHDGKMLTAQGTPTQSFFTLWLLRKLALTPSDVQKVRLKDVQNLKTMLQVATARHEGVDPATMLERTKSFGYASTPLTQFGVRPVPGSMRLANEGVIDIGYLMGLHERAGFLTREQSDALLREYGFTREDRVPVGFDITFNVQPSPAKASK